MRYLIGMLIGIMLGNMLGDQSTFKDCATSQQAVMLGGGAIKCEVIAGHGQPALNSVAKAVQEKASSAIQEIVK